MILQKYFAAAHK